MSIALGRFVTGDGGFDFSALRRAVKHAVLVGDRFADLVVQLDDATSEIAHSTRPVCVGIHGLADVLILLGMPYTSSEARITSVEIYETFYSALLSGSCSLAEVHGTCSTWARSPGEEGRHYISMWPVEMDPDQEFDVLRRLIAKHGLRNSVMGCLPPMRWFPAVVAAEEALDPHYRWPYSSVGTPKETTHHQSAAI